MAKKTPGKYWNPEIENAATELEKAEQQLTGFSHAIQGFSLVELVESMGLRLEEWQKIRKDASYLTADMVEEIDEYFEKQEGNKS